MLTAALAHAQSTGAMNAETPLYIEGLIRTIAWEGPDVELVVDVPARLARPVDLVSRVAPSQHNDGDISALLAQAVLPTTPMGAWTITLPPLPRLAPWDAQSLIRVGRRIAIVGIAPHQPTRKSMRAEVIFVDGKTIVVRSLPREPER
ncbi:MAG TPA: hypothetical protein VFS42_02225 [Burkholderiaceae bacterium]|nr:hypothetical protein [Burkholderiaceae bacterium]